MSIGTRNIQQGAARGVSNLCRFVNLTNDLSEDTHKRIERLRAIGTKTSSRVQKLVDRHFSGGGFSQRLMLFILTLIIRGRGNHGEAAGENAKSLRVYAGRPFV